MVNILMNKIKIILLEKSHTGRRNPDFLLLSQFQYCHVFVGVGVNIWYDSIFHL